MFSQELAAQVDELRDALPFPIAATAGRLAQEMRRNDAVAALLVVRDAIEVVLKFASCLAIADLRQSQRDSPALSKIAAVLLNDRGLSTGHWPELLCLALEPVRPPHGGAATGGACLPLLHRIFYTEKGKRTALYNKIEGGEGNFIKWRNDEIGHGVFKEDRAYYAQQVERWASELVGFCAQLRTALTGWRLVALPTAGEPVVWHGAPLAPVHAPHTHLSPPGHVDMALRHADGRLLNLGPLLTVQRCLICDQPAAFFLDHRSGSFSGQLSLGTLQLRPGRAGVGDPPCFP
jgi:hypothetical protein